MFRSLFIPLAVYAATWDFELPTFWLRKRNYLFKFETSILSPSVTLTFPSCEHPIPMRAKLLMNSHPRAPAPTKNNLSLLRVS